MSEHWTPGTDAPATASAEAMALASAASIAAANSVATTAGKAPGDGGWQVTGWVSDVFWVFANVCLG